MQENSGRIFGRQHSEATLKSSNRKQHPQPINPYCFYHPQQFILYFCTNSNSLQTQNHVHCHSVTSADKYIQNRLPNTKSSNMNRLKRKQQSKLARGKPSYKTQLFRISKFNNNLKKQIDNFRDNLLTEINSALENIVNRMKISESIENLHSKSTKIEGGSIRSLIQYYNEERQTLALPSYAFYIEKPSSAIRQLVEKAFTMNENVQKAVSIKEDNPESIKIVVQGRQKVKANDTDRLLAQRYDTQIQENSKIDSNGFLVNSPKFSVGGTSQKSRKKGLSVHCVSERGESPSHIQNSKQIPVAKILETNYLKLKDSNSWKKVINMKDTHHHSSSRLVLQNNIKTKLKEGYSCQNAVLTPVELRQFCKYRNATYKKQNINMAYHSSLAHAKSQVKILYPSNKRSVYTNDLVQNIKQFQI